MLLVIILAIEPEPTVKRDIVHKPTLILQIRRIWLVIRPMADLSDDGGRRRVVRHGDLPERSVRTGIDPVAVRHARVRDRQPEGSGGRIRFTSSILPPYPMRAKLVEELMTWLYPNPNAA